MTKRVLHILNYFTLLSLITVVLCFSACKKKNKLAGNNISFNIIPPAASVVKGQVQTLKAEARTPGGLIATNPQWEISGSAGTLNTLIGPQVTLTTSNFGDVTITATYDGMQATSQVAVVTFIPTLTSYNVYTDLGLPVINGVPADIATNAVADPMAGQFGLSELSTGYTTEGSKYQRATDADNTSFWGVDVAMNQAGLTVDLSSFSGGTLKFSIRLGRSLTADIGGGAVVRVNVIDNANSEANIPTALWSGFDNSSTDWQEISLSLATIFASIDETQVRVPFQIHLVSGISSPLTIDIDAIRWES